MASFRLDYVRPADVRAVALLDKEAFYPDEHPYIEAMHPASYTTPEGFEDKVKAWRDRLDHLLPNEHFFKVTETSTQQIVLTGTWFAPCKDEENLANLIREPKIAGPYWKK